MCWLKAASFREEEQKANDVDTLSGGASPEKDSE
jgi:hypothetical protein